MPAAIDGSGAPVIDERPAAGRGAGEGVDSAWLDDLTGLYNRRFVYPFVRKHLAAQPAAGPLGLLLLDLDRFGAINDAHGHSGGDAALRAVAERLRQAAGRKGRAVRWAGDRFVVLFAGAGPDTRRVAERVRRALVREPYALTEGAQPTIQLQVTAGLATTPEDGSTVAELVASAGRALHAAREAGGDRLCVAGETAPIKPPVRDLLAGFPCPRCVGRGLELARAESLSHLGERGPTTLVQVRGEGGVGKTRLLKEMARRRREAGDLALWTSCREELRTSPYGAVSEVLRHVFAREPEIGRALAGFLGEEDLGVLARRVPGALDHPPPADEEADRTWRSRFFSVTLEALRYLGREHQLALLIDDLQYADAATLKIVTFLMRHDRQDAQGAGVPIFATIATDAVEAMPGGEQTAFAHFERFTAGWPTVGTIDLDPLEADAVRAMVDACFDSHQFPPEFASRVHQVTAGNPLFVEEVLIVLAVSGFIAPEGAGWRLERRSTLTLPDNLHELLLEHLGQLDQETSDALLKASVIGSQFSVDLLKRVLGVNEGRAAQLADRAIDFKLLSEGDPAAMEGMRFANRRLQQLTYQIVGEEVRRDVHRKVASLQEHFEVIDLDSALAEIAWHAERGGEGKGAASSRARQAEAARALYRSDEADHYFEVAGKVVAPRIEAVIPEAVLPLGDDAAALLPTVMKGLMTVYRGVQMYPPGSQYVRRAVQGCQRELRRVLERQESLTLKERSGALEVNSKTYPKEAWGSVGDDLVRAFRRARVHSVTFTRAAGAKDLEALGHGMVHFAQQVQKGGSVGEEGWKELLVRRGCRGVGVVPKQYRATTGGDATLAAGSKLEGLAAESERHLPLLRDILRFTAGTAEAIQLYPRGSETVTRALSGLTQALGRAHRELASVNLGVTADGFLVNDLRLDARTFGDSVDAMLQLFARAGVRSLSFDAAVQPSEIEQLFRYLMREHDGAEAELPWRERLRRAGVHHVGVDEYVFVAADAQGGATGGGGGEESELIRIDQETFLRKVLEGSPGDLLDAQIRSALPDLLTELVLDGEGDAPQQVVARIFANLDAPEPHLRADALQVISTLLSSTSSVVSRELKAHCTPFLGHALREERAPGPLAQLITISADVAEHLLLQGELRDASRILWQLGKGFQVDAHVDEGCRQESARRVARLMQTDAFERALAALWTPNEKRRALALHLLESCGKQATDYLVELAVGSPDAPTRRVHAEQLRAIADPAEIGARLTALVTPYEHAQRVISLLEVLEQLGADPVPALVRAFQHPHDGVRDAATGLLRRATAQVALRALDRLGRFEDPRLKARVVTLISELAPAEGARQLVAMLRDPSTPAALRVEVVHALGRTGDDRILDHLVGLLTTNWWRRLFKRDAPSELAIAAVWALGTLGTARALEAVEEAQDHPDPRVRNAADAVLPERLGEL